MSFTFILVIIVFFLFLLFFNLKEDGRRPRDLLVLCIFALFKKVSEVSKVENLLQLDVLLLDRILDLLLQLNGEGKKLGGWQVDFLILDRKSQIDEVLAELGIVFCFHEKGMLLQSILNDFECFPNLIGDPSLNATFL